MGGDRDQSMASMRVLSGGDEPWSVPIDSWRLAVCFGITRPTCRFAVDKFGSRQNAGKAGTIKVS